jgi:hypothetical protein
LKDLGRKLLALNVFGGRTVFGGSKVSSRSVGGADGLKRPNTIFPGEVVRDHRSLVIVAVLGRDGGQVYQAAGVLEGQGPEQHGVDHAEDGGVRANAKGEGQDSRGCKERSFNELTAGVGEVLP